MTFAGIVFLVLLAFLAGSTWAGTAFDEATGGTSKSQQKVLAAMVVTAILLLVDVGVLIALFVTRLS